MIMVVNGDGNSDEDDEDDNNNIIRVVPVKYHSSRVLPIIGSEFLSIFTWTVLPNVCHFIQLCYPHPRSPSDRFDVSIFLPDRVKRTRVK